MELLETTPIPWAQGVAGSNHAAPTILIQCFTHAEPSICASRTPASLAAQMGCVKTRLSAINGADLLPNTLEDNIAQLI